MKIYLHSQWFPNIQMASLIEIFSHGRQWFVYAAQVMQRLHYSDVIMGAMASQITSLTIACSTVYSGTDQRNHQSSASLAFVRGIHRWPVNSPHKWPVTENVSIGWRHHVDDTREQGICSHRFGIIFPEYSSLSTRRLSVSVEILVFFFFFSGIIHPHKCQQVWRDLSLALIYQ